MRARNVKWKKWARERKRTNEFKPWPNGLGCLRDVFVTIAIVLYLIRFDSFSFSNIDLCDVDDDVIVWQTVCRMNSENRNNNNQNQIENVCAQFCGVSRENWFSFNFCFHFDQKLFVLFLNDLSSISHSIRKTEQIKCTKKKAQVELKEKKTRQIQTANWNKVENNRKAKIEKRQ